jgi:glycosyltransferase involved in cell wall biosynthesis
MRVALTAEGTYPHQFGGVSVWCDQLIRALPNYEFTVVALVATGTEPVQWELPQHVSKLVTVPLWGPPSALPRRRSPQRRALPLAVRELVDVLLDDEAAGRFGLVLRDLYEYAKTRNLTATLASEAATRLLAATWRERWPLLATRRGASPALTRPTLHDAVTAMQLVEHALRPLSYPAVEADVAHAVTNGLGVLPALVSKWRYQVPVIVTEHGVYMREQYLHLRHPPFGWPVKDLYLRFLAQICAVGYREAEVITPGNVYNKRWEEELGADGDRVRTVYNGVNPDDFPAVTDEPEAPTISWVGRIDPIKDLETLLRAFALVMAEIPEARLRIFGSPPRGREAYQERCKALAHDLGLDGNVTFEGRIPKIRDAYAAGNVVVLCSISEGFPYSLIEAMTCGRPCVATDVGGVSEALPPEAGIVVPPRAPGELAAACLKLLRDPELRASLGATARKRALEHFTVDRAVTAFDEIYNLIGTGLRLLPGDAGHVLKVADAIQALADTVALPVLVDSDTDEAVEEARTDKAVEEARTDKAVAETDTDQARADTVALPVLVDSDTDQAAEETKTVQAREETETDEAAEETETVQAGTDTDTDQAAEETETVQAGADTDTVEARADTVALPVLEDTDTDQALEEADMDRALEHTVTTGNSGTSR